QTGHESGVGFLARRRHREVEIARAADPGRRRPQRAFLPDDRRGAAPQETRCALRGNGDPQRNPRLPAPRLMDASRRRDRGFPATQTGNERSKLMKPLSLRERGWGEGPQTKKLTNLAKISR